MAYFSEQVFNDLKAAHEFNKHRQATKADPGKWESIAVIPELSRFSSEYWLGIEPELIAHNEKIWGPSFFFDDIVE